MYGNLDDPKVLSWLSRNIIGIDVEEVPSTIIVAPYSFDALLGRGALLRVARLRGFAHREVRIPGRTPAKSYMMITEGRRVALFLVTGVGVAFAADVAMLLSKIPAVVEVIFLGSAACISDQMKTRDFNLPSRCVRNEKILEDRYPLEIEAKAFEELRQSLSDKLEAYAERSGQRVHNGLHCTVPYLTSETIEFLTDLKHRGIYTVDMELSVYYTILGRSEKRVAGVVVGEDRPLESILMEDAQSDRDRQAGACLTAAVFDYLEDTIDAHRLPLTG